LADEAVPVSRLAELRDQFLPWAGLAIGIAAVAFAHQFGSDSVFDDCMGATPGPLIVVTLLCAAVIVLAGMASWRVYRNSGEGPARRLIAIVSAGASALFIFALIFPIIASLMLPGCFA
jgi:uncharacterized membrane protein